MALTLSIQICDESHLPALNQFAIDAKHSVEDRYFETAFQEQQDKKRLIFLAFLDEVLVGYAHLNFFPQYTPFLRMGIPEIQDLVVHPDTRRQGIGEQLIKSCEQYASEQGRTDIGIGVGVTGNFGNAQRLYVRSGYVPDGAGAVFERTPVSTGEFRPVDDRLCLMMVKSLDR